MAMLNKNLTYDDAKWLIEQYQPKMSFRIDNTSIRMHLKAFNLMKGSNEVVPSCSCQWRSAAQVTQSMFNQYKSELYNIYNGGTEGNQTLQEGDRGENISGS